MSIDPDTCTIEELRDELARLTGMDLWTLDAIASLIPLGWCWELNVMAPPQGATAYIYHPAAIDERGHFLVGPRDTPIDALARCVAKVLTHIKGAPQ